MTLINIACPACTHLTEITISWLLEHGAFCEGCYRSVPLNRSEVERNAAMIDAAWGLVDLAVDDLRQPLG
jgi:hypothetical protein